MRGTYRFTDMAGPTFKLTCQSVYYGEASPMVATYPSRHLQRFRCQRFGRNRIVDLRTESTQREEDLAGQASTTYQVMEGV